MLFVVVSLGKVSVGNPGFWCNGNVICFSWIFPYFWWDNTQNRKSRVLHAKAGWSYLPFTVQL